MCLSVQVANSLFEFRLHIGDHWNEKDILNILQLLHTFGPHSIRYLSLNSNAILLPTSPRHLVQMRNITNVFWPSCSFVTPYISVLYPLGVWSNVIFYGPLKIHLFCYNSFSLATVSIPYLYTTIYYYTLLKEFLGSKAISRDHKVDAPISSVYFVVEFLSLLWQR